MNEDQVPTLEEKIVDLESRLRRAAIEQTVFLLLLFGSLLAAVFVASTVVVGLWRDSGVRPLFIFVSLIALVACSIILSLSVLNRRSEIASMKHELMRLRSRRKLLAAQVSPDGVGPARRLYKEETREVIDQYRAAARRNRRVHNMFQACILIGSIVVTSLTSAALGDSPYGLVAAVISVLVSVSAAFTGYFKFRDRGFNQQQTADAIEKEFNSAELLIWDYRSLSADEALTQLAQRVEALKEEQRKRELQLEQSSREEQPLHGHGRVTAPG